MEESKQRIEVSPAMLCLVGPGAVPADGWPQDSVTIAFAGMDGEASPVLRFDPHPGATDNDDADIVLIVAREACKRLFGGMPPAPGCWYLSTALRTRVLSILECEAEPIARPTLQGARGIELLFQAFADMAKGELVPADGGGVLSETDATRIAEARRIIDERWQEKLTLDGISRACGINRAKLVRGFRTVYNSSVADAIAENRLTGARRLLLATDLPVSTVGYRCGYLNNASFTRAFSRRYGVSPSQLRHGSAAA